MNAKIYNNLGYGRYDVIIDVTDKLLQLQIEDAKKKHDDSQILAIDAGELWNNKITEYRALVESQNNAISLYQECLSSFSYDDCVFESNSECFIKYTDELFHCHGDADCISVAESKYAECRLKSDLNCKKSLREAESECRNTHINLISIAQKAALEKKSEVDGARIEFEYAKAKVIACASRVEELEAIEQEQKHVTCFHAQYDDSIEPGTSVILAHGPGMGYSITSIYSTNLSEIDSRSFPSTNLFVNAALETGRETWVPSWRTGTVLSVTDDKLEVRFDPGFMYGSLGSMWSKRVINCTPSQSHFDHDFSLDTQVDQRRSELDAAQNALASASSALQACIRSYDIDACTAAPFNQCEITWADWLALCRQTSIETCDEEYAQYLNDCKSEALASCLQSKAAHDANCRAQYPLDGLRAAVDQARAALLSAQQHLYSPADPLVIKIPVAHCDTGAYQVGDRVLVDFPNRGFSEQSPMAVWDSARVVGWYQNPRDCMPEAICINNRLFGCDGDEINRTVPPHGKRSWSSVIREKRFTLSWTHNTVFYKGRTVLSVGSGDYIYAAAVRDDPGGVLLIAIILRSDQATGGKAPIINVVAKRLYGESETKTVMSRPVPLTPVPQYIIDEGIAIWNGLIIIDDVIYYRMCEANRFEAYDQLGLVNYFGGWRWFVDIEISPDATRFLWVYWDDPVGDSYIPSVLPIRAKRPDHEIRESIIPDFVFDDVSDPVSFEMTPVPAERDFLRFSSNLGDNLSDAVMSSGHAFEWIIINGALYLGAHYSDDNEIIENVAYFTSNYSFPSGVNAAYVDMEYCGKTFRICDQQTKEVFTIRAPMFLTNGNFKYDRRIMIMTPETSHTHTTVDYSNTDASVYFDGELIGSFEFVSGGLHARRCTQWPDFILDILSAQGCLGFYSADGEVFPDEMRYGGFIDRPCGSVCVWVRDIISTNPLGGGTILSTPIRYLTLVNGHEIQEEISTIITPI